MKLPTREQRERERRLAIYEEQGKRRNYLERRRAAARKGLHPKRFGAFIAAVPRSVRFHGSTGTQQEFASFAASVDTALRGGRRVCIDFTQTERLFPCGMLLLLGWLESWLTDFPNRLYGRYPANDLVEQMLQSADVLQRLGLTARKIVTHDDVMRWHQFQGHNADATSVEAFMLQVREATDIAWQMGLADCVNEALTNVVKHAYAAGVQTRWWMFATVEASTQRIFVAMHDRGDSIPASLLTKPGLIDNVTARRLRRGGDTELIAAALGGRTRTRLYYRGNGLPEMLEFTRTHPNNGLAIYSRSGSYVYDGKTSSTLSRTLMHPVEGTLVIWTLNYEGAEV